MHNKFSEGSRLDNRPPHPRGWIGGMIANKLVDAGWEYILYGGGEFSQETWYKPDKPNDIFTLEGAHWKEFGTGL